MQSLFYFKQKKGDPRLLTPGLSYSYIQKGVVINIARQP